MIKEKKEETKKNIVLLIIWIILSLVLIFIKEPVGFISDEFLYKRIAYSLFTFQPAISTHYPILYPMLIQIGFLFGANFYVPMLIINIAFKGCCLVFIYRLLKKVTTEKRAFIILVIIAFSPIYFGYSRVLFAENMAAPLLIINVLYHEIYREKLLDDNISGGAKLGYGVIAALLSLSLYWTKYLMLVTLPVFCLFWSSIYFSQEDVKLKNKIINFIFMAIIYTLVVLCCIIVYGVVHSSRTTGTVSMEVILSTMGFFSGSGPANNGYAILAEWKWLYSYGLYAMLGASPIIAGMIMYTSRKELKNNWKNLIWYLILILALIYVSARHSTYVDYNEGWKMMNLCGRYVAYTTPLLAICWIRTAEYKAKKTTKNFISKLLGISIGCVIVWVAYELLYVLSPGVEQSHSWLTGLRAADNAGFTNLRVWCCFAYCVGMVIIAFANQWGVTLCMVVLMLINSFAAVVTIEKWHETDWEFSLMCRDFFENHKDEDISIMCTKSECQVRLYNQRLFYDVGDKYTGIVIRSIGDLEDSLWFGESDYSYLFPLSSDSVNKEVYLKNQERFEGNLDEPYVFYKWDNQNFTEIAREIKLISENGTKNLVCEDDDNLIFVTGTYILPVKHENGQAIADISKEEIGTTVYVYDIDNLTVSKEIINE